MEFQLIAKIKKYLKLISSLTVVLLVLGLSWYLYTNWVYFFAPRIPKPNIVTVENQDLAKNVTVNFNIKEVNLLKPVIFSAEERKSLNSSNVQRMANYFGFQQNPTEDQNFKTFKWEKAETKLEIFSESQTLRYLDNGKNIVEGGTINLERIKQKFRQLYQNLDLNPNFIDFENPKVTYALSFEHYDKNENTSEKNPSEEKPVQATEANLAFLTYPLKFQGQEVWGLYPERFKAQVTYGRNDTLIALDLPLVIDSWNEFFEYPTLSKSAIARNLENNNGTLVRYKNTVFQSRKTEPIIFTNITKVSTGYLMPPVGYNYLLPIYILESTGEGRDGLKVETSFYLTAFEEKVFE